MTNDHSSDNTPNDIADDASQTAQSQVSQKPKSSLLFFSAAMGRSKSDNFSDSLDFSSASALPPLPLEATSDAAPTKGDLAEQISTDETISPEPDDVSETSKSAKTGPTISVNPVRRKSNTSGTKTQRANASKAASTATVQSSEQDSNDQPNTDLEAPANPAEFVAPKSDSPSAPKTIPAAEPHTETAGETVESTPPAQEDALSALPSPEETKSRVSRVKSILPRKKTSRAKHLAPVPKSEQPKSKTQNNPEVKRVDARAHMLAALASLQGVTLSATDIAEQMHAAGDKALRNETMVDVLMAFGLRSQLAPNAKPNARDWPAIAVMQGGQPVLVLEQSKTGLVLFDTTCPDNRADVAHDDFMPYFTGKILTARPSLSQLAQRHTPQIDRSHWFWGEFPKYRRQLGEIMLGSLVANLLAVSVALFSLQVYDRVVPHQSQATLWVLAIGALIAICLEGVLKIARARITDAAGRQVDMAVQRKLMQRLIGLRADKRPLPPSGLFSAMRDFSSVREFFTSSTLSTLADVPFIAVFLLLVASIGGPVVWVIITGGILMLLPGYFLQKRMIALTRQTQGASTKSARLLHEVVSELETIKTQRGEDRILRLWDELNLLSSQASNGQRRLSSALTYWSQAVQQATYICAVILGTYMVFAGEFTVGTIIATGILTSRTLAPLTQFAGTLARWSNVRAALDALDLLAKAPQERETGRAYLRRDKIEGHFELHEAVFRYDDEGAPIVDVPAAVIQSGQRIAVLGINGSGKSTLLKLLSGLYGPDKGRVMLDGTDMSQIEPRDLRRHIGYLGQDVRLFAGTLRDNLNLTMLERDDARLMEALEFAGLGQFVRAHPRGLDLVISDNGAGLSIGQRQSLGWARLWLQDPTVVLLDEPTAALDQTLERTLVSRLENWLGTRTTIIATHRLPILSLTNRTMILQSGRLVVDGPRDEVMAHLNAGNKS